MGVQQILTNRLIITNMTVVDTHTKMGKEIEKIKEMKGKIQEFSCERIYEKFG